MSTSSNGSMIEAMQELKTETTVDHPDQKEVVFRNRRSIQEKIRLTLGLISIGGLLVASVFPKETIAKKDAVVTRLSDPDRIGGCLSLSIRSLLLSTNAQDRIAEQERNEIANKKLTEIVHLQVILENAMQDFLDKKNILTMNKNEDTITSSEVLYAANIATQGINNLLLYTQNLSKTDQARNHICVICQEALYSIQSYPDPDVNTTAVFTQIQDNISSSYGETNLSAYSLFIQRLREKRNEIEKNGLSKATKIAPNSDTGPNEAEMYVLQVQQILRGVRAIYERYQK